MAFHLLNYFVAAGVNAADTDAVASAEPTVGQRNNHFIFTDPFKILGAAHMAPSATRSRFNSPTLNAWGRQQIWPINRAAVPPSLPRIMDLRMDPIDIPTNEEIAVEVSNNLGAATEATTVSLWVAPPSWNRNRTRGNPDMLLRATAAVARVANAWSGGGNLVFTENLRAGVWAVNGAWCVDANCRMFRLLFPRGNIYNGRLLRPGSLCTNAIGNLESAGFNDDLGEWGRFHTFEPPTVEVYGDAAGASTQDIRLWVSYLGDRISL